MGLFRRSLAAVIALLAVAALAAGCSSSNNDSTSIKHAPSRGAVEAALAKLGLPKATITCVTNGIFSKLSAAELRQVVDQSGKDPDTVSPELRQRLLAGLSACVPATTTTTVPITAAP